MKAKHFLFVTVLLCMVVKLFGIPDEEESPIKSKTSTKSDPEAPDEPDCVKNPNCVVTPTEPNPENCVKNPNCVVTSASEPEKEDSGCKIMPTIQINIPCEENCKDTSTIEE